MGMDIPYCRVLEKISGFLTFLYLQSYNPAIIVKLALLKRNHEIIQLYKKTYSSMIFWGEVIVFLDLQYFIIFALFLYTHPLKMHLSLINVVNRTKLEIYVKFHECFIKNQSFFDRSHELKLITNNLKVRILFVFLSYQLKRESLK